MPFIERKQPDTFFLDTLISDLRRLPYPIRWMGWDHQNRAAVATVDCQRKAYRPACIESRTPCQPQRRVPGGGLCRSPRRPTERSQFLPRRPRRQTVHRHGRGPCRRASHQTVLPPDALHFAARLPWHLAGVSVAAPVNVAPVDHRKHRHPHRLKKYYP